MNWLGPRGDDLKEASRAHSAGTTPGGHGHHNLHRRSRVCGVLDLPLVKLASSDLNDWVLIEKITTLGVPVIASTGQNLVGTYIGHAETGRRT